MDENIMLKASHLKDQEVAALIESNLTGLITCDLFGKVANSYSNNHLFYDYRRAAWIMGSEPILNKISAFIHEIQPKVTSTKFDSKTQKISIRISSSKFVIDFWISKNYNQTPSTYIKNIQKLLFDDKHIIHAFLEYLKEKEIEFKRHPIQTYYFTDELIALGFITSKLGQTSNLKDIVVLQYLSENPSVLSNIRYWWDDPKVSTLNIGDDTVYEISCKISHQYVFDEEIDKDNVDEDEVIFVTHDDPHGLNGNVSKSVVASSYASQFGIASLKSAIYRLANPFPK